MSRCFENMKILDIVATRAKESGLQFLVIGGHAVNAYGERRQTGDVDLLVREADRSAWLDLVASMGYSLFHQHKAFLQFSPSNLEVWPLDLMLVEDRTLDGLLAESEEVNFGGRFRVDLNETLNRVDGEEFFRRAGNGRVA